MAPSHDSYRALVTKDGIRWLGPVPALVSEGRAVEATVVVRGESELLPLPGPGLDGKDLVALLDRIADAGAFDGIEDPVEWQRRLRAERE